MVTEEVTAAQLLRDSCNNGIKHCYRGWSWVGRSSVCVAGTVPLAGVEQCWKMM